jgi:hypothetical protein
MNRLLLYTEAKWEKTTDRWLQSCNKNSRNASLKYIMVAKIATTIILPLNKENRNGSENTYTDRR